MEFKDGKPKVVLAKKSEYKVAMFDIICLHRLVHCITIATCTCDVVSYTLYPIRQNDMRVSLHSFEPASVDDPRIKSFVSGLKMPEPGVIHFVPRAPDGEWSVTHIRHKKWGGYYFRDFKYVVTISTVGSYDIQETDLCQDEIAVGPKNFRLKHETEVG